MKKPKIEVSDEMISLGDTVVINTALWAERIRQIEADRDEARDIVCTLRRDIRAERKIASDLADEVQRLNSFLKKGDRR